MVSKEEVAIQDLKIIRDSWEEDLKEYMDIAIKSVEKQIPKDVIVFWDEGYPDVDAKCPSCEEFWDALEFRYKYCPGCGQRLRWPGDD